MSQQSRIIVKAGARQHIEIRAGAANRIITAPGQAYQVVRQAGDRETPLDDVIAIKRGNHLALRYRDGTEIQFDDFYIACQRDAGCGLTLPGDTSGGYTISAQSPVGPGVAGGSLVYAHGDRAAVVGMASGDGAMQRALSGGSGQQLSWAPQSDDNTMIWLGGLGLGVLAAAGGGGGGGGGGGSTPPPVDPPASNELNAVRVQVVGGPVIATNGLEVELFTVDGKLIGRAKLDANGQLTMEVGEYRGVVIARVPNDPDTLPDHIDEATGQGLDLDIDLFAMGVIEESNSTITLNLNLLTLLAYRKAVESAGTTALTADDVRAANAAIADLFQLDDLNAVTIVTTNARAGESTAYDPADGLSYGERYGAILAALSGMDAANGGSTEQTVAQLLAGITVTGGVATLDTATRVALIEGAAIAGSNAPGVLDSDVFGFLPDIIPPVIQSATTSADGNRLVLVYDEPLSASAATAGSFSVRVDGSARTVSAVSVSGSSVTLTLSTPVGTGQTVTVAYNDPDAGNDSSATQDVAGNDAASFAARSVTNIVPDTTPPTLLDAATSADGTTLVLRYDEPLSTATATTAAFAVNVAGAPRTVSAVAVSGDSVTLTLASPVAFGQSVTVAYTDPGAGNDSRATQDAAGNDAASFAARSALNTVPDTTPPTLLDAATSADGATLVLRYDELLSASTASTGAFAVSVAGAVRAVSAVAVIGSTVVLTLAAPVASGESVTVAYTDPGAGNDARATQDGAGNDAASFAARGVVNNVPDTAPPVLLSASTSLDGATVVLEYDQILDPTNRAVTSDFEVSVEGARRNVGSVTVTGSTVVLTLSSPVEDGDAITVAYTDPSARNDPAATQDISGNDAASLNAQPVENRVPDATPPQVLSATTTRDGSGIVLTYDEPLSSTAATGSAFVVRAAAAALTVEAVSIDGDTVTLTLDSPVIGGQVVTVSYTDPGAGNDTRATQDVAGNDAASFAALPVTNTLVDTRPPLFKSAATTIDGTALVLTYDEPLSASVAAKSAFIVKVDGLSRMVDTVATSGSTVVLTLRAPVGYGESVSVAYNDPGTGNDTAATQDLAGNDAVTLSARTVTNLVPDITPPAFVSAATSVDGTQIILTYDEALATPVAARTAFTVKVDGISRAVSTVGISGMTVILTMGTAISGTSTVTVAYTDPSAGNDANATQDRAGNDALTLAPQAVTNAAADITPPLYLSATTNTDGSLIVLTYDEPLSATVAASAAFTVKVGGVTRDVSAVAVNGSTVELTLASAIGYGESVTVAYTDPSAGNDGSATQDLAGNDAATLSAKPVTNAVIDSTPPALVSSVTSVSGGKLILTYDETLDDTNAPVTGDFAVEVDGIARAVTGVSVSGSTVELTLASAVEAGQAITVDYTDPSGSDDSQAIQDAAGNDAASLIAQSTVDGVLPLLSDLRLSDDRGISDTDFLTTASASPQVVEAMLSVPLSNGQSVWARVDGGAWTDVTGFVDGTSVRWEGVPLSAAGTLALQVRGLEDSVGPTLSGSYQTDGVAPTLSSSSPSVDALYVDPANAIVLKLSEPVYPGKGAITVSNGSDVRTIDVDDPSVIYDDDQVTISFAEPLEFSSKYFVKVASGGFIDAAGNPYAGITDTRTLSFQTSIQTQYLFVDGSTRYEDTNGNRVYDAGTDTEHTDAIDFANKAVTLEWIGIKSGEKLSLSGFTPDDRILLNFKAIDTVPGPQPLNDAYTSRSSSTRPTMWNASFYRGGNSLAFFGNDHNTRAQSRKLSAYGKLLTDAGYGFFSEVLATWAGGGTRIDLEKQLDVIWPDPARAPELLSAESSLIGDKLLLTYDETLSASKAGTGAFAVTVEGVSRAVTAVSINGDTVELTLASKVKAGQAITVGYTDPSGADDAAATQDARGNDAATLPPMAVDNKTLPIHVFVLENGTAFYDKDGDRAYDAAIDDGAVSFTGRKPNLDFANDEVVIDFVGLPGTVNQIDVSGFTADDRVILDFPKIPNPALAVFGSTANGPFNFRMFTDGILQGTTWSSRTSTRSWSRWGGSRSIYLSFEASGSFYVYQTNNGKSLSITPLIFSSQTSINYLEQFDVIWPSQGPAFRSAETSIDGSQILIDFHEELSAVTAPGSAFTVTVAGESIAVTAVSTSGTTATLTLATPVLPDQPVSVAYKDPTVGNDPNAIQDKTARSSDGLSFDEPVTNKAGGPQHVFVLGDGTAFFDTDDDGRFDAAKDTTAVVFDGARKGDWDAVGRKVTFEFLGIPDSAHRINLEGFNANDRLILNLPALDNPFAAGLGTTLGFDAFPDPSALDTGRAASRLHWSGAFAAGAANFLVLAESAGYGARTKGALLLTRDAGAVSATRTLATWGNDTVFDIGAQFAVTWPDTAPKFVSAATTPDGSKLILTCNEAMDGDAADLPTAGLFSVKVDGSSRAVTGIAASGSDIVLTLASAVGPGQVVTVAYKDPTVGNDARAAQDLAGNDTASLPKTEADNMVVGNAVKVFVLGNGDVFYDVDENGSYDAATDATPVAFVSGQTGYWDLPNQAVTIEFLGLPTSGNDRLEARRNVVDTDFEFRNDPVGQIGLDSLEPVLTPTPDNRIDLNGFNADDRIIIDFSRMSAPFDGVGVTEFNKGFKKSDVTTNGGKLDWMVTFSSIARPIHWSTNLKTVTSLWQPKQQNSLRWAAGASRFTTKPGYYAPFKIGFGTERAMTLAADLNSRRLLAQMSVWSFSGSTYRTHTSAVTSARTFATWSPGTTIRPSQLEITWPTLQ